MCGDQSDIDISSCKHAGLDMLCWMIEEAFEGGDQSLMANLKDIREED